LERWADENYRGSPHNPLSDADLEAKFRDCAEGLLDEGRVKQVFSSVWSIEEMEDVGRLFDLLDWKSSRSASS